MTQDRSGPVIATIDQQVQAIHKQLMSYPWHHRKAYANWLAQTYYYVRRVTHVLSAAASRTSIDEPVLHRHFLRGITEEVDHDLLATNDLRELGFDVAQLPEHPLTKAYYQTLFYMIDRAGPAAILGYFFVLEGLTGGNGEDLYKLVSDAHGGKAVSFLKEHIVLDADHYPQALALMKTLDEVHLPIIKASAELGGPLYRYMVEAVRIESLV
jgi:hypothetical protein